MITTFYKIPQDLPLDHVSGAFFAYSLRRLSSVYNGKSCRVRRDSDNTERDIGFTIENNFDIPALIIFLGAANGYIVKLYDQSGNGHDIAQPTAANQPKIQLGVVNGLPSVIFSKSSSTSLSWTPPVKPANYSIFCAFKVNSLSVNNQAPSGSANGGSNKDMWGAILATYYGGNVQYGGLGYVFGDGTLGAGGRTLSNGYIKDNVFSVVSQRYTSGSNNVVMRANGLACPTDVEGTATSIGGTSYPYYLGRCYPGTFIDGGILEHIVYNAAISDAYTAYLETNIRTYYGI